MAWRCAFSPRPARLGGQNLLARLLALAAEGVAVLAAEHRLEPFLAIAHRVLRLEAGRIVWEGPAARFRLDGRARGQRAAWPESARPSSARPASAFAREPPLVSFHHGGAEAPLFAGLEAAIHPGEEIALTGPNGAR